MIKNPKNYLAILCGALYALGFPNILNDSFLVTSILGFALLFILINQKSLLKEKLFLGLLFCVGFNYTGFYWITDTLAIFGDLPWILAALLGSLFSFVVMIYLWPMIFILHLIQKKNWLPLSSFKIIFLSLLFTLIEYFSPEQFPTWIGQPWILLSQYLGAASIYGIPGFSFISFIIIFLIIDYKNIKTHKIPLLLVLIFIIQNIVVTSRTSTETQSTNIRVVQANIGNYLKIESETGDENAVEKVLTKYLKISTNPTQEAIDLIIWPETAYPYSMISSEMRTSQNASPILFQQVIGETKAEFLTGGYDENINNQKNHYQVEYNASFFLGRDGLLKDVYHKHKLIPFGETLPFGPLTPYLAKYITGVSYFSEGSEFPVFKTDKGVHFITPICYELLKPEFLREYFNRNDEHIDLIINLTNDSWYGKTAEPRQHLFLAKWRALEFNVPIIRSTNTGITSVIYQDGTESIRLNTGDEKSLDLTITTSRKQDATTFQKWGFLTTLFLALVGLILQFIWSRLRKIPL